MRAEIELPPLPDGWADGPVEIGYGEPPRDSLYLWCGEWKPSSTVIIASWVYAVRKWQPAIVTAGVLSPGWVVIDPDGTFWHSDTKPTWDEDAGDWAGSNLACQRLRETPQVTGLKAIWEIK